MSIVQIDGVSYGYGAVQAVRDVSLRVDAGAVVAMLGPNGAGKSTTINLLLGLLPPAAGTVRLFGGDPHAAVAAGRVGAMPQVGGLPPRSTPRDLLTFLHGLYRDPMPLAEVLDLADLGRVADRTVEHLSGGEAQRVRFAMAVTGRPDLLVLDEPTAALDVAARHTFWSAIRSYTRAGRTVLFSTHYLEEVDANADRIVVLDKGRVIADGTAAAIKRRVAARTVSLAAGFAGWAALPGVVYGTERTGRLYLTTTDSDATVLALAAGGHLRDLEVVGADLESAFLALTGSEETGAKR